LGNRYQVTVKEGYTQTFTHNINNQYTQIHEEYGLGLTGDFYPEHDNNGNLETDSLGNTYTYDYRNRLIKVQNPNSNTIAEYTYDALGRRVSKTANGITTYFFYDDSHQVISSMMILIR